MKHLNLKVLLSILVGFTQPVNGLFAVMFFMVILDTMTAIYATIKINGIKSFKSSRLFNIAPKVFFYFSSIFIGFMADSYVITDLLGIQFFIAKLLTVIFSYIEIKSIDETIVKMGYRSIWAVFKDLIKRLKTIKKDIKGLSEEGEN